METCLTSSIFTGGNGGGAYVKAANLWQAAVVFTVRRIVKSTWINNRDQFLQPSTLLTEEFKNDCLIWMLFSSSNLTAGADGLEWQGKTWSLVNHFIPFTEGEVNAPDQFESDFMVQYLAGKTLTPEAKAVLDAGRTLWQAYFTHTDERSVRDEYKLNRPDVGWYQIRNALKARNASSEMVPVSFNSLDQTYQTLTDKLRPLVFELGFLR